MKILTFIPALLLLVVNSFANGEHSNDTNVIPLPRKTGFTIEGNVNLEHDAESFTATQIIINYGQYLGFLNRDGNFKINNLPSGSYLIEVVNPNLFFKPVRVDITSKGKIRARKVNYIQTSMVQQVQYPLRLRAKSTFKYFQIRETWRLTDFLFNPMILMMVLPMLVIMGLSKMKNAADAELVNEMQQMPKLDVPDFSEVVTNWLSPGSGPRPQQQQSLPSTKPKAARERKKQ